MVQIDPTHHDHSAQTFLSFFEISLRKRTLQFLELILSHFSQFPYENISKIIKYQHHFEGPEKIRLPSEVMEDHAKCHLGGTCFSLTFFLQTVLEYVGFLCYPVMADMRWGKNVHCCLVVTLDSMKYLVDPGYLLTQPMEINEEKAVLYRTEFTGVELDFHASSRSIDLYTFDRQQKKWRYRFHDQPVSAHDFLNHWLASFQWNSMHGLCLTKVETDRMIYVHKKFMRETTLCAKRNINIKQNYHEAIHSVFRIEPKLVEAALAAIDANMARERELGLWTPNQK